MRYLSLVLITIAITTHSAFTFAATSYECWNSGIVTQNSGKYIVERRYNASCSLPSNQSPVGNQYKFSTLITDLDPNGQSLCALRSWRVGNIINNSVASIPSGWVVTEIAEDNVNCRLFANGVTFNAFKLNIEVPTEETMEVCEYFPGFFDATLGTVGEWIPQPIPIPSGYSAQVVQNANCWQLAGLRLTRNDPEPPVDPPVEPPIQPPAVSSTITYIPTYSTGVWYDVESEGIGCNLIAGANNYGLITAAGTDNRVINYISSYASGQWNKIADPGIKVGHLTGDNRNGPIVVGGPNGRTVKYMSSYAADVWNTIAAAPFEAEGITGGNSYGPIIYSGSTLAVMTSYATNQWRILSNAPAPFIIKGISGNNRNGVIAHSGAGNQIAYITNYASGVWKSLTPPIEGEIVHLSGNNERGAIVIYETGEIFYIPNYAAGVWYAVEEPNLNELQAMVGTNSVGISACGIR